MNPEGVARFANTFSVWIMFPDSYPGRCPGLGFANTFGVQKLFHQTAHNGEHLRVQ